MAAVRAEVGNLAGVLRLALDAGDRAQVVPLIGLLASFWTIVGDHITVLSAGRPVLDLLASGEPVPGVSDDELCEAVGITLINESILTGTARHEVLEIVRGLTPTPGTRVAAMRALLLAMDQSAGLRQNLDDVAALELLGRSEQRQESMLALQWYSHVLENNGDLVGARQAAERAIELCVDDDGPWARAMLDSMLAGIASQSGDPEGCIRHAGSAVAVLDRLGATQDCLELRSVVALCELRLGRVDVARAALEQIAREPESLTTLGWSAGLVGLAELALVDGDVDRGLRLYRECVAAERGRRYAEIADDPDTVPWLMYSQAAALWAHVVSGRAHDVADLADEMRGRVVRVVEGAHLDYPVTGCVLLAVGGYDLVTGGDPDRAVTALALAHGFSYQQSMPSMAWPHVAALAEEHAPGLLDAALARYAERLPSELRGEASAVFQGR